MIEIGSSKKSTYQVIGTLFVALDLTIREQICITNSSFFYIIYRFKSKLNVCRIICPPIVSLNLSSLDNSSNISSRLTALI